MLLILGTVVYMAIALIVLKASSLQLSRRTKLAQLDHLPGRSLFLWQQVKRLLMGIDYGPQFGNGRSVKVLQMILVVAVLLGLAWDAIRAHVPIVKVLAFVLGALILDLMNVHSSLAEPTNLRHDPDRLCRLGREPFSAEVGRPTGVF